MRWLQDPDDRMEPYGTVDCYGLGRSHVENMEPRTSISEILYGTARPHVRRREGDLQPGARCGAGKLLDRRDSAFLGCALQDLCQPS